MDELRKLAGVHCLHQDVDGPGCAVHARRPKICRSYRCLWLRGGLSPSDRPDRLQAVVDVVARGPVSQLEIREARVGCFETSPRLQAIAQEYRSSMPVQISDVANVLDPDRPYRVLLPNGEENRIAGEWVEVERPDEPRTRRRLPWAERIFRRIKLALHRRRFSRFKSGPRPVP